MMIPGLNQQNRKHLITQANKVVSSNTTKQNKGVNSNILRNPVVKRIQQIFQQDLNKVK